MSEADFRSWVIDLARLLKWDVYYIPDSRAATSKGFPDLTLRRDGRVLFRELKTNKGRVAKAQKEWLADLQASGCDAGIWRPRDHKRITEELFAKKRSPISIRKS